MNTGGGNIQGANQESSFYDPSFIVLQNINYYSDLSLNGMRSNKARLQISGMSISAAFIISNPAVGILFLRFIQVCEIYKYVDIELPANLEVFYSYFDNNILNLVPEPKISYDEAKVNCLLHPKIVELETNCLLMNNGGIGFIVQLAFYAVVKGLVMFVVKNSQDNKDSKFYRFFKFFDTKLNLGFAYGTLLAVQLDLLHPVFINMRNFFIYPFMLFVNSVASLGVLVMYAYYVFIIFKKLWYLQGFKKAGKTENQKKGEKQEDGSKEVDKVKVMHKRWFFLKEDLKEDLEGPVRFFSGLVFIKDFLVVFSVIAFLGVSFLQIGLPMAYNLYLLYLVIRWRPLNSRLGNFLTFCSILTEILCLVVYCLLFVFRNKSEEFKYKVLGKGLIGIMILAFLIFVVASLLEGIEGLITNIKALFRFVRGLNQKKAKVKHFLNKIAKKFV